MNISNAVNKIYYQLKPFIPRWLQILLRRKLVLQKRLLCTDVWPIDEKAGKIPEGWTGWPEGKKFALVLTHDVETIRGHDRCHNLIKLEKELGFKSAYYFVPERYRVSRELRDYLTSEGFEVGVHGLKHDGKLYKSEKIFRKRALKINQYLKEWQAVGFGSPSMHNNLEWLHELNIEYDSSTFDTDPFEPQSEGVQTIFPFRVSDNSTNRGYVELPYTLPQDFTLFVLMQEKNIDIWKKKLDWIAEHGGMVLINAHPDYMDFEENGLGIEEYPAEYYKEFLKYIKSEYEGQYWNVLSMDIARFCSKKITNIHTVNTSKKKDINSKKPNILMIVENPFPSDIRVRKVRLSLRAETLWLDTGMTTRKLKRS